MRIAVSTDLRSSLVDVILTNLKTRGFDVLFFGPDKRDEEVDWTDVTFLAAQCVAQKKADEAIVMCWTGTGCSILANKMPGIRAALCLDAETAKGARIWNHANVLALSLRVTSEPMVKEILDLWFSTPFSEDDWNRAQMKRLSEIEALCR